MTRGTGGSVALVLGAGGTPGGAFIRAALAELEAHTGWTAAHANQIVGTSVGALNAARLACHPFLRDPDSTQFGALTALGATGQLSAPVLGMVNRFVIAPARTLGGRALARFGPQGTSRADYDVATGPFRPGVSVVSVSRRTGKRRVVELHTAKSPTEELYASAAIPGFAVPRELEGQKFVDGAAWSTTNADVVDIDSADALIVIAPMVPRVGGSLVQRGHRASLAAELYPWLRGEKPVLCVLPPEGADRDAQEPKVFAATARNQILKAAELSGRETGPLAPAQD